MKKFFIPFISFIVIVIIIGFIIWLNTPNIAAHILSKEFNVPVSIRTIDITKNHIKIEDLNIGTPKDSRTVSSFFSKKINVQTPLKNLRKETLTVNSMTLNNNVIGVEFYNSSGSDNNWSRIMKTPTKPKKESKRKYHIKKLTLNNITVVITKQNGQKQTFPTIERLVFYDITDETGFPIEELEKAIANEVLRSVFQKFNLLKLLEDVQPAKLLQKVLPLKF